MQCWSKVPVKSMTSHLPAAYQRLVRGIVADLKAKRVVLFCGAGISRDSGLPLAAELSVQLLRQLPLTAKDRTRLLAAGLPFELILQTLTDSTESVDTLLETFSPGRPNTNHHLIARLVASRWVRSIVTTNFDLMLEQALEASGLRRGLDFRVYLTERAMRRVRTDNKPTLIHLHGSLELTSSIAATLFAVASHDLHSGRRRVLRDTFGSTPGRTVIVLGYSWSDTFDVSPVVRDLDHSAYMLLVSHREGGTPKIERLTTLPKDHPLRGHRGCVLTVDTGDFLRDLASRLWRHDVASPTMAATPAWQHAVFRWGRGLSVGRRCLAASNLMRQAGYYDRSLEYGRRAHRMANRGNDLFLRLKALECQGQVNRAMARYRAASRSFMAIVALAKGRGNLARRSEALKDLATTERALGNMRAARRHCDQAIAAARSANQPSCLAHALACRAGLLSAAADYRSAASEHVRAARAFGKMGQVRSQAAALVNAGVAFMMSRRFERALKCLTRAGDLAHDSGDQRVLVAVHYELGSLARRVAAVSAAAGLFRHARQLASARQHMNYVVGAFGNLAGLYAEAGKIGGSRLYLRHALKAAERAGSPSLLALARETSNVVPGRPDQSLRVHRRALLRQLAAGAPWLRAD